MKMYYNIQVEGEKQRKSKYRGLIKVSNVCVGLVSSPSHHTKKEFGHCFISGHIMKT